MHIDIRIKEDIVMLINYTVYWNYVMYIEDIWCMQILYSIILQRVVESNMLTHIDKFIYGESVTPNKFLNVYLQEVSPAASHHLDIKVN